LREKLRPDEAEAAGCGGSTVKADNEVWPDFHRNPGVPGKQSLLGWKPSGRGYFSPFLRRSSLRYARYLSLLTPRTEKKWLPSPPIPICRYTLGLADKTEGIVESGEIDPDRSALRIVEKNVGKLRMPDHFVGTIR
jgi:hypothetical protein